MSAPSSNRPGCTLRVLVVENELMPRELNVELLRMWGYRPVVAEGEGEALLADARRKAQERRCQIALVDMHLLDDHDPSDWSGLELVADLLPTVSIILSGSGDRTSVGAALTDYRALRFVGKQDGPERLRAAIETVARSIRTCNCHAHIGWSDGLSSARIRDILFPEQQDVPDDEADELIGRLFPDAQRVTLALITDNGSSSDRISTLRRRSRVFRATVDNQAAFRVVKIAHKEKISRELANYRAFVEYGLQDMYRPQLFGEIRLWDMGATAFSYIGNSDLGSPGGPQTFTTHYRTTRSANRIMAPINHFFSTTNWGGWYKKEVTLLSGSLFEAYDAAWKHALSEALAGWRAEPEQWRAPALDVPLPNPTRWLADHLNECAQVVQPRQAVTHGDLHGDNLFVDKRHSWPIDFERTGPGPILRDFVELTQDLLTRIAPFGDEDLPVVYELAVALCAPQTSAAALQPTVNIRKHPEAWKAFQVVRNLLQLAASRTGFEDWRELLWGLLLNNLFVFSLLSDDDPRRERTLLIAAVICARLERWSRRSWPPRGWPPVEWEQVSSRVVRVSTRRSEVERPEAALVRARLTEMSNDEFDAFCQDHFPQVALKINPNQALASKVNYLIRDCLHRPEQWRRLSGLLVGAPPQD